MHHSLSLLNQGRLCLLLPPGLLVTLSSQLLNLLLEVLVIFFHCVVLGLVRLGCLRGLLTDPGFGALFDFHGDYVLHSFLDVIFVEMRGDLPVLELLKKLIFLPNLLPLLLHNVLQFLRTVLPCRHRQRS